ncbi:MAG: transglutaminase family protein [Planctomycetales bacterium]|nr:transglutaminase family protein [Planctomycetales bacterium]
MIDHRWPKASLLALLVVAATTGTLLAQFDPLGGGADDAKVFRMRYKVGVVVTARTNCQGIYATIPVPSDWPEQVVRVAAEDVSQSARVKSLAPSDGVPQMAVTIPFLPAGQSAQALVTYDIERRPLPPPAEPDTLVVPRRLPLAMRRHLGDSPFIEKRHGDIRGRATAILKEHSEATAWRQVEAIYDWVRDNVKESPGKLKGAVAALRDGAGNNEDRTSLFIALCRASDVPARTVWIPDSCYAEFLLADASGEFHWLPCRLTGEREFGQTDCEMPVLQKGDNFRVPQQREAVRYMPEFLKGAGGSPDVDFVRMPLPAG